MHPSLSSTSGGPSWSLTTPELLPGSEKVAGSPQNAGTEGVPSCGSEHPDDVSRCREDSWVWGRGWSRCVCTPSSAP